MIRVTLAVLGLMSPMAIQAQKATPRPACVFDTAAHRDTVAHVLSVVVLRGDDTMPHARLSHAIGTMIREHFRAPESIGALFYPNVIGPLAKTRQLAATLESSTYGSFGFSVGRDGTLNDIRRLATTGDSATDLEIIRALGAASDSGEGAYLVGALRDSDDGYRVLIVSRASTDAEPLVRLLVPTIHADRWPSIQKTKAPVFPASALRAAISAVVEVEFIIDETGHVLANSIRLVSAPYLEFAESAEAAILAEQFRPAEVGGCSVKMRVRQHVRYSGVNQ